MTDRDDPAMLAVGSALGSLTPEEQATYDAYRAASADGRREADEFERTAKALANDVAEAMPSADLKGRLMAQVAVTPQVDASIAREPVAVEPAGPAEERARARWFRRPGMILAAAAAAAVLFVGGAIGIAVGTGSSTQQVQATTLAQISAAPDAQRATQNVAGGGAATLIWSKQLGKSALVVDGLKAAPSGKTYQLWYINGNTATSAGLLTADAGANSWRVLDGQLKSGDVVGMTIEPSGGSKAPTTKPIATIQS